MIVADCSAVVELLKRSSIGRAVEGYLGSRTLELHAPHLLDLEVAQVLRRWALHREMDATRAHKALEDFGELRIRRYSHTELLPGIWELRGQFTAYDACYVVLARALGATLVTSDGKLARAAESLVAVKNFLVTQ